MLLLDEFGGLSPDEPERCDAVLRRTLVDRVAPAEYRSIDAEARGPRRRVRGDRRVDRRRTRRVPRPRRARTRRQRPHRDERARRPTVGRTARVELAATTVEGAQRYFGGRVRPTWGVTVGLGRPARRPRGVGAGRRRDQGGDRAPQLRGRRPTGRAGVAAAGPPELHVVVRRRRRQSAVIHARGGEVGPGVPVPVRLGRVVVSALGDVRVPALVAVAAGVRGQRARHRGPLAVHRASRRSRTRCGSRSSSIDVVPATNLDGNRQRRHRRHGAHRHRAGRRRHSAAPARRRWRRATGRSP